MSSIRPTGFTSSNAGDWAPAEGGGGEGNAYVLKRLIDFTQESNHDFKAGSTYTDSKGLAWTVGETTTGTTPHNIVCGTSGSNDGISEFFQIVSGTGLKVQSTKDNWSGIQTPKLILKINSIIDDYDIQDRLFICVEIDPANTTMGATTNDWLELLISNSDNSHEDHVTLRAYQAPPGGYDLWQLGYSGWDQYAAGLISARGRFAMERSHWWLWAWMKDTSGDFPISPSGMTGIGKYGRNLAKNMTNFSEDVFAASTDKIVIDFYTNNSSNQATWVIKKLGIYRYE